MIHAINCLFWLGQSSKYCCFKFQEVMTVYLGFTFWYHSQLPQPHWIPVWLDSCSRRCHWDTQETSARPCDWLTYHVVAVIVAPYMVTRALSLTGASGLARLLFLRNRNVHRVLPQTHTLPALLLSLYTRWVPAAAPHIYTSYSTEVNVFRCSL